MPKPAFKLEDLFGGATNIAADPNDPNTPGPIDPNSPPPDGGDPNVPLPDPSAPLPPLDMPFPTNRVPMRRPTQAPKVAPLLRPPAPSPWALRSSAASPTSATTPGSFADPGSSAARPPTLAPHSLNPRNQIQAP